MLGRKGWKSAFFLHIPTPSVEALERAFPCNLAYENWSEKLESLRYPTVKTAWSCVHLPPYIMACDRQVDRQKDAAFVAIMRFA